MFGMKLETCLIQLFAVLHASFVHSDICVHIGDSTERKIGRKKERESEVGSKMS